MANDEYSLLADMMQRAEANLQDAMQRGDKGKADRMAKHLNRLHAVAEQKVSQGQAQTAKLPGTDNGGPAGLLPKNYTPTPPEVGLPNFNGKPVMLPEMGKGMNIPPDFATKASAQMPWNSPPGVQSQDPFPDAFVEGAINSPAGQGFKAVGEDAMSWLKAPAALWQKISGNDPTTDMANLGKAAGNEAIRVFTGDNPKAPITPAEQEKTMGSTQNAAALKEGLKSTINPFLDGPGVEPDYNPQEPGAPAGKPDMGQASPETLSKVKEAANSSNNYEDFKRMMKEILGPEPTMFSPESLMTLIWGGFKGVQQNYQNEKNQYNQSKTALAGHWFNHQQGQQDRQTQLDLQKDKNRLEEAKIVYEHIDKRNKAQADALMAELKGEEDKMHNFFMSPTSVMKQEDIYTMSNQSDARKAAIVNKLKQLAVSN